MKALYMINIGGKAPGANIEVHDLQFIIAENIEETEQALREHWYGLPLKLHMDSYKKIIGADGYRIEIREEPYEGDQGLYFLHIGGYDDHILGELHKYGLLVRDNLDQAKKNAMKTLYTGDVQEHVDSTIEVATSPLLNACHSGYIHLVKSDESYDLTPDWNGYHRIDRKD